MYQRFEFVLIKLVAKNFLKRKKPAGIGNKCIRRVEEAILRFISWK
jgi:hypothetical protein